MKRRPAAKTSWLTVLLVIAALAVWTLDQKRAADSRGESRNHRTGNAAASGKPAATGGYESYQNCALAGTRGNDGDSFLVRLPDGRKEIFRLYFVDSPESAFKRYSGGETNHERIRQQAADMGGITPEQAVATGVKARALTLGLLGSAPFDVFTRWDSPFRDQRYHAFIRVREAGQPRWLHELLVERGLARIKTKPADLPDGTPANQHLEHLRELERQARRGQRGAWGL